MLDYTSSVERLHTRSISFDLKQYLFVAQVVFGESETVAYAMVYDTENFKNNICTESESEYLSKLKKDADVMIQQQECVHLKELIEESLRSEIQRQATNIEKYKFSSEDVVNILSKMLAEKSSSLDEASVRDIVSLIRELNSQGALEGNGDGFSRHFVSVFPKFQCICNSCNREIDVARGLTIVCPHCGAKFVWSNDEERYYPEPIKV